MFRGRIGQLASGLGSAVAGPTSALVASQGLVLLSSLLVNIASARVLGPSGRGELALHLQIAYLLSAGLVLGRDQALLVHYSSRSVKAAHVGVRRLALVPSLLCVGLALIIAFFFSHTGSEIVAYFTAYAAMLSGSLCFRLGRSVAIATARSWSFALAVGASQVLLGSGGVVLFVTHQGDPVLWLLVYGLASCLPIAGWSLIVGRGPDVVGQPYDRERALKRLGLRMIPGAVADVVLLRLDRLLLPIFGSYSGLGIYVVASTFSELSSILMRQFVDARVPTWKRRFDDGSLRALSLLALVFTVSIVVSALVGVASHFAIPILFGADYAPAMPLVPVLAVAASFYGTSRLGIALAVILEVPKWASIINGMGAAVGVVVYLLLIPTFGPLGAAFGSLASYAACALATLVLCVTSSRPVQS